MSIRVENVWKRFKNSRINTLESIDTEFNDNEFVCILGPSGCGKTTLLNIIAGLENATDGKVLVDQNEIRGPGIDRAVMFQESALFPWLNVIENVKFGMSAAGLDVSKKELHEKAQYYLEMVHLIDYHNYYIHQISGGMKQRVALARALALDSRIMLMDEPFAALDSPTKTILRNELIGIWQKTKKTIIFVTHNPEEAVLMADRIIMMSPGPGRIKNELAIPKPRCMDRIEISRICEYINAEMNFEVEKVG